MVTGTAVVQLQWPRSAKDLLRAQSDGSYIANWKHWTVSAQSTTYSEVRLGDSPLVVLYGSVAIARQNGLLKTEDIWGLSNFLFRRRFHHLQPLRNVE